MGQPVPKLDEQSNADVERPAPTWFPQAANESVDDLAKRYRQRQLDREAMPRPVMPRRDIEGRARYYRDYPHEADLRQIIPPQRRAGLGFYAFAGFCAMLMGGATGFAFSHTQSIATFWHEAQARIAPGANVATASMTVVAPDEIPIKPITTATLDVKDASGNLNDAIPLALHAEAPAGGEDLVLKLDGLPKEAFLSNGTRTGPTAWELDSTDASSLKVTVPHADAATYDVAITAVGKTSGELAAPPKELKLAIANPDLTAPAAGPPQVKPGQALIPSPVEQQVTIAPAAAAAGPSDLASKGNQLLAAGDPVAARAFYAQAYAQGLPEGALGMAKTYDPIVYANLKIVGLMPDKAMALDWYGKAAIAGQPEAAAALAALKSAAQ